MSTSAVLKRVNQFDIRGIASKRVACMSFSFPAPKRGNFQICPQDTIRSRKWRCQRYQVKTKYAYIMHTSCMFDNSHWKEQKKKKKTNSQQSEKQNILNSSHAYFKILPPHAYKLSMFFWSTFPAYSSRNCLEGVPLRSPACTYKHLDPELAPFKSAHKTRRDN